LRRRSRRSSPTRAVHSTRCRMTATSTSESPRGTTIRCARCSGRTPSTPRSSSSRAGRARSGARARNRHRADSAPPGGAGCARVRIDLSRAMVAKLRERGAEQIHVVIGDFTTTNVEGAFSLVYLVFNTIMNLTTQDEQIACVENAARHLQPGGSFVIEVGVPDLQRLPPGETFHPFHVDETHLGIDEYDLARQGLVSHHYRAVDGAFEKSSIPFRYLWPSELDLMARLGGLGCGSAGAAGGASRSRATAASTSRSERSRGHRRWQSCAGLGANPVPRRHVLEVEATPPMRCRGRAAPARSAAGTARRAASGLRCRAGARAGARSRPRAPGSTLRADGGSGRDGDCHPSGRRR